jgi:hypothetical protein
MLVLDIPCLVYLTLVLLHAELATSPAASCHYYLRSILPFSTASIVHMSEFYDLCTRFSVGVVGDAARIRRHCYCTFRPFRTLPLSPPFSLPVLTRSWILKLPRSPYPQII